jgi:multiple sugar transport system substrate-binding protein
MKKWLLVLAVIMVLITTACSKKETAAGPSGRVGDWFPKEKIQLRWSFWASNEEWPYWSPGMDSYTRMHPNVTFVVETTPWGQYWDKLTTQVAANATPDITGMVTGTARAFMVNQAIMDLKPYMDVDSQDPNSGWKTDDYWPGIFEGYEYNNGVYAIPYDMGPSAICINMDIFDEFGVPLPEEGWTFQDMISLAKKLTIDRDGDGVTDVYGLALTPDGDGDLNTILIGNFGTRYIEGEFGSQTAHISPVTVKYMQMLADGIREGWNYSSEQANSLGLFESGKLAMSVANPERFGKLAKLMSNPRLYAMEIPMPEEPEYKAGWKSMGGGGFSAARITKYPEVCWDFLKHYLNRDGVKITTADAFRGIPPLKTLMDDFNNSQFAPHNVQALTKFLREERPSTYWVIPNANAIRDVMLEEPRAVYAGMKTAKQAMDDMITRVNVLLKTPE